MCAFGATFWQAHLARKHNKLSVKPYLTSWYTSNNEYHQLKIVNNGMGPAQINSFNIYLDDKKIQAEYTDQNHKCIEILFSGYTFEQYGSYLGVGYMMPAKEEKVLLAVKFTGNVMPSLDSIRQGAKRVKILIEYESIYGEKSTYDSSKEIEKQKL